MLREAADADTDVSLSNDVIDVNELSENGENSTIFCFICATFDDVLSTTGPSENQLFVSSL